MTEIQWICKPFDIVTPHELYAILQLRSEVFVVEQNCIFQDIDGKDQQCYHLMGLVENNLVAYARLMPAGVSYNFISIGRIATSSKYRNKGAGKALLDTAIEKCNELFGRQAIKIGAQLYLKNFYESFGFIQIGEVYDEDGILHVEMIRNL